MMHSSKRLDVPIKKINTPVLAALAAAAWSAWEEHSPFAAVVETRRGGHASSHSIFLLPPYAFSTCERSVQRVVALCDL